MRHGTLDAWRLPKGRYDVALDLPSPDASVAGNADCSVQTANTGTWKAETGRNDLRQSVLVRASTATCATPAERIDG